MGLFHQEGSAMARDNEQLRRMALQLLCRHDHNMSDRARLTRENCSACVLNGYHPRGEKHDGRPNYAGWLRVYIQAGKRFDLDAARIELTEARNGATYDDYTTEPNLAYYNAILDDAEAFGCPRKHSACPVCAAVGARKEQLAIVDEIVAELDAEKQGE
jgi:hypothetical protein